ncbi:MAG TPA: hypothetical protein VGB32_05170 [Candidatus Bathyarchaeia archaeon]
MEGKDRSLINTPARSAKASNDLNTFWDMTHIKQIEPLERLNQVSTKTRLAPETMSEMEDTLKDLVRHEEYVRNIRQEFENKLRIFVLNEASSEFTRSKVT